MQSQWYRIRESMVSSTGVGGTAYGNQVNSYTGVPVLDSVVVYRDGGPGAANLALAGIIFKITT